MLAYIEQFGFGRQFEILIEDKSKPTRDLESMAHEFGAVFVGPEEAKDRLYQELLIHSYFKFDIQTSYQQSFHFDSLTYYSDGLRNGFYGLPSLDYRLQKLIYFGFQLKEDSFESNIPQSMAEINRETVSFSNIERIWKKLQNPKPEIKPFIFKSSDFLLVMRYWGLPGPGYQLLEDLNVLDYLKEEFSELPNFDRLIFRAHPWFDHKITRQDLQNLIGDEVEVIIWEDVFQVDGALSESNEPESVIYRSTDCPGLFFGFDSSLNILVAEKWPTTQIIWPDPNKYSRYFLLQRSSDVVQEQIKMMQEYRLQSSESEVVELKVDGHGISNIISSTALLSSINSHTVARRERDALTQERDALTQERDALTQERDALTQERDAIVNSTIWRATRFIRALVSLARRTLGTSL
jgi:hypothetical protein